MRFLMFAAVVMTIGHAPAFAQKTPSALSAWVVAPAAGATSAVAYVAVDNPTMYDFYVTGATADVSAKVELRGAASGGAEPAVVPEYTVPAYSSTAAEPTAPHLRLVDLKKPLAAGDTVQLTLTTDGGLTLKVSAPVK